mgnify:CR=1 FL=1
MRSCKGFTVTELLACMAIMAVLFSMSVGHFSSLRERQHAAATINQLSNALQLARASALSQRKRHTLCPSANGENCSDDWSNGLLIHTGTHPTPGTIVTFYPRIGSGDLRWHGFGSGKSIQFQGNGYLLVQNGSFIYCPPTPDPRLARALIINKSGRIRAAEDRDGDGVVEMSSGQPVSCTK